MARLGPSPATGLVGMAENNFLSTYFGCLGLMSMVAHSEIRETIVKLMTIYNTRRKHYTPWGSNGENGIRPWFTPDKDSGPSTCTFWSAIAVGALLQGRPKESVERYIVLARDALRRSDDRPTTELMRAWILVGRIDACSGMSKGFQLCKGRVRALIHEYRQRGHAQELPLWLTEYIKVIEECDKLIKDWNTSASESFCRRDTVPVPEVDHASTNDDICIFILRTYRNFEELICRSRIIGGSRNYHEEQFNSNGNVVHSVDVDYSAVEKHNDKSPSIEARELVEQLCERPEPAAAVSIEQATNEYHGEGDTRLHPVAAQSASSERVIDLEGIDHLAMERLRDSLPRVGTLEIIAKRILAIVKSATREDDNVLHHLRAAVDVLNRYPGLIRCPVGLHIVHRAAAVLTTITYPEARDLYNRVRDDHNRMRSPGSPSLPPFEEWQGLHLICNYPACRVVELLLRRPRRRSESIVTGQSFGASGEHDMGIDDGSRDIGGVCLVGSLSLPARGAFQRQPVKEADNDTWLPVRRRANYDACCGGEARGTAENTPVKYNEPTEPIPMIKVEESRTNMGSSSGKYTSEEGNAAMNIAQLPVCGGEIEDQEIKMTTKGHQEDYVKGSFTDTSPSIASDAVAVSAEDWLDVASHFSHPLLAAGLDDARPGSS